MFKNKIGKILLLSILLLGNSALAQAEEQSSSHDISALEDLLGVEKADDEKNMSSDEVSTNRSSRDSKRIIYITIRPSRRGKTIRFKRWSVDAWKVADSCNSGSAPYLNLTHYVFKRGNRVSLQVPAGYRYDGYKLRRGFDVYGSITHETYTVNHNFRYTDERRRRANVYMESHYYFNDGYFCYIAYEGLARR